MSSPRIFIIMFMYMFLMYSVSAIFNIDDGDDFNFEENLPLTEGKLYDKVSEQDTEYSKGNITLKEGHNQNMDWWTDIPVIGGLQKFFGSIFDFFGMILDMMSFGLTNPSGLEIPPVIQIIFTLAVMPCWVYLIYVLTPFAIETIKAVGNLIPFT